MRPRVIRFRARRFYRRWWKGRVTFEVQRIIRDEVTVVVKGPVKTSAPITLRPGDSIELGIEP